jgi:hypothetical protein
MSEIKRIITEKEKKRVQKLLKRVDKKGLLKQTRVVISSFGKEV